jgi:hypothetical protein
MSAMAMSTVLAAVGVAAASLVVGELDPLVAPQAATRVASATMPVISGMRRMKCVI